MSASPIAVVTGGAGFIGSHTVDKLIELGHRVVVLDNFSTGKRANLARWLDARHRFDGEQPALEIVTCDVAHGIFAALAAITTKYGPVERIVHLAAQVSVVASVANPLVDMQVNYGGTLHVLEYARAMGVKKVAFASSAAVYGEVSQMPVGEDTPTKPMSPYGIDKLASEFALDYYAAVHGVATTALRFFNVYGPRQDPTSPYSGVISIFADRAKAGQQLVIFGDGQQTRDFVYVGDVVRAIVAAVGDGNSRAVANVGTGGEITVVELARTLVDLCTGAAAPRAERSGIVHAPARAGEILKSRARVDVLRDRFGVVAETKLVDGLRATLADH
ncbi:MAG: NAD-dependent epimerase/dehydratase family protein [Deltaproteobacteria bacterium]|nr:NAD-dependent epimerase/dehydratase family protein [Deltaproteobacteria bacterium]MDQ3299577.1 NAD-dependent epimerase/dehydratase family protein [Myxococcota bacterium]